MNNYPVLISLLIMTVPTLLLHGYVLFSWLRVPWTLAVAALLLVLGLEYVLLLESGTGYMLIFGPDPMPRLIYFGFYAVYLGLSLALFKTNVQHQLYLFFTLCVLNCSLVTISFVLSTALPPPAQVAGFALSVLALSALTVFRVIHYVRVFHQLFAFNIRIWYWGWVPVLAMAGYDLLYVFYQQHSLTRLFCNAVFNVVALTLFTEFVIWFMNDQTRYLMLRQRVAFNAEISGRRAELERLAGDQEASDRALRGRLEHYLNSLEAGIARHDAAAIARTVAEGPGEISTGQDIVLYSQNDLLNTILSHENARARRLGVRINFGIMVPEQLGLSDQELCTLLGNLFDNAYEALSELPENQRWMTVKMEGVGQMLAIAFDNSCDSSKISCVDGHYLTRKKDARNHGIGLASISDVVERRGGTITISHEHNRFCVSILLTAAADEGPQRARSF